MTLSPRLPSKIWAIQKEIKDAYPKKVCDMPKRHEKKESAKKREKMHTQRKYATCPQDMSKKRRKEKNNIQPMSKKKNTRREIDYAKEFIHYQPKIFHTLAQLDQIV